MEEGEESIEEEDRFVTSTYSGRSTSLRREDRPWPPTAEIPPRDRGAVYEINHRAGCWLPPFLALFQRNVSVCPRVRACSRVQRESDRTSPTAACIYIYICIYMVYTC